MSAKRSTARHPVKIRQITIYNKSYPRANRVYAFFPIISLSGKWLQDMGFESGQVVTITCSRRQLIIRTDGTHKYPNDNG